MGHSESMDAVVAELRETQRELATAREEAVRSKMRAADLKQEVEALRSSMSWRLSAPLRAPRIISYWVRDTWTWSRDQLERADGWMALLRAEFGDFRRYGAPSILCVWKTFWSGGEVHPTPVSYPLDRNDYSGWLQRYREILTVDAAHVQHQLTWFAEGPLISVVMPVYNPPPALLEQAIASVQRQVYPHWELCIADDASTDPKIAAILRREADADPRIKVVFRTRNGHISATSNSALALAEGLYIALLDHDDLLPEDALYWVAEALNRQPDAAVLYSDEDRIDESGARRYEPYFKPDFNYELLLAQNMISHLGVYDRSLVQQVGGFREGFEGSQDLDLVLRIVERVDPRRVVHIPRILYHWRAIKGSTALENSEKGYASGAAQKAVGDHLLRSGRAARVEPCADLPIFNQIRPVPPDDPVRISLILGDVGNPIRLARSLRALAATAGEAQLEFIFVGAQGSSALEAILAELDFPPALGSQAVAAKGAGFGCLRNHAAAAAVGDYLAFVDCAAGECSAGWLTELAAFAAQPDVGFVTPRIFHREPRLDHGGILWCVDDWMVYANQYLRRGLYGKGGRAVLQQRFAAVSPVMMLCRTKFFEGLGGFDEGFQGALGGVDMTLMADAEGFHNLWLPQATITLQSGEPWGKRNLFVHGRISEADRRYWRQRWPHPIGERDYNPNLSVDGAFSLAWPPRLNPDAMDIRTPEHPGTGS